MIQILFRWLSGSGLIWTWGILLVAITLWWLLLRGIFRLLRLESMRPGRVVALGRLTLFLAGAIFMFDVALVPVVLVAFHGIAGLCLAICTAGAIVFMVRVNDQDPETVAVDRKVTSTARRNDSFPY